MKRTIILISILIVAGLFVLAGCESAGQAYRKFSGTKTLSTPTVTKTLECSYRLGKATCDRDTVVQMIQNTDCTSDKKTTDCSAKRMICKDGECITPCRSQRSTPYCYGSEIRVDVTNTRCERSTERGEDCAGRGAICRNGECILPESPIYDAPAALCDVGYNITCHNSTHMVNATITADCEYVVHNYPWCPTGCNMTTHMCN